MHVEVLVEEPSAEAALSALLPRLLGPEVSFEIRIFQGKPDMLNQLPERLRAYPNWLPHTYGEDWCVVVLVDEDRDDCRALKAQLEKIAAEASLPTKTSAPAGAQSGKDYYVVNRIAVEELESWFFGDLQALRAAYPKVPDTLRNKRGYRDPDAIKGGTAEALERVLSSYYPAGMPKVEVAQRVAPHMDLDRNRSHSFKAFRDAMRGLVPET